MSIDQLLLDADREFELNVAKKSLQDIINKQARESYWRVLSHWT